MFQSEKFIINGILNKPTISEYLQGFVDSYNDIFTFEDPLFMPDVELDNIMANGDVGKELNLEYLFLQAQSMNLSSSLD
ncbi:MAG: hypothetical protein GF411_13080 [Candidatus Lokiarchaeota archaeon]|nr:hypothetical protein [Candidatus Lokiarchaeota archaeon]